MSKKLNIFDRAILDSGVRTPQGFLRIPTRLTRTGVFKYRNADGSVSLQLRHPDDVFKEESIATLRGVPFTNEHPKKLVDPKTVKAASVGWLSDNIEKDMIYLKGDVIIADEKAIEEVESGKREVSCGYTSDVVDEKGFYNGEEYNCRQTNIVYNHVSLVKKGRAGSNVKLQLDSDEAELIDENNSSQEGDKMAKIKIGNCDFECSAEMADAFNKQMKENQDTMDGLKKQMADMMPKNDADKMQAKCDTLEAEVKELKTKMDSAQTDESKVKEQVKARVALITQATKHVKAETKLDDMSDLEIKKAVLTEKRPSLKLDGQSEAYISAAYDMVVADSAEDKKNQEALNKKVQQNKDSKDEPVLPSEARKKMIADSREAWKTNSEITK
ncbi:DUF2213 domain-containing protein [Immundisolibacter sp.]